MSRLSIALVVICIAIVFFATKAQGLITGMVGNTPTPDRDWPGGTLELANMANRLGFWEGPPFGGGEYHFLYRGDTDWFQQALDQFAKIRAPELRLIISEGVEESFWLKNSQDAAADAKVDWTFIVWTPRNWHSLYNNPNSTFLSRDPSGNFRNPVAPPTLAVNVAGPEGKGIDWSKIKVPAGMTVTDERATTAGYQRADGSVLRGDVYDMITSKPVGGAEVTVGKLNAKNGYDTIAHAQADGDGHFELKHIPAGSYRVSISAEGHAGRVLGYEAFGANTLRQHTVQLATPITVRGSVRSTDGKPLAGVKVRPTDVLALDGRGYSPAEATEAVTDGQGNFELAGLPEGYFSLMATDDTHQQVDVLHLFGPPMNGMPAKNYDHIALTMTATGTVKGKVLTPDGQPDGKANVSINATGEHPNNWGGGTNVKPDGTFEFTKVPPGRYLLSTKFITPGTEDPTAKAIEVKAGETVEVQLTK